MKNIICRTGAALLVLALTCQVAFAVPDCTKKADALKSLGLFRGSDTGYALDETFTRAQGAAMIVRLIGRETEALDMNGSASFSDVGAEHWANGYIAYCAANHITKGTGNNTYSPEDKMTCAEYLTLLLRYLGFENASPETAGFVSSESGLLSSKTSNEMLNSTVFTRNDMVYISYGALSTKSVKQNKLLAELLIEQGVFSQAQAKQAGISFNTDSLFE